MAFVGFGGVGRCQTRGRSASCVRAPRRTLVAMAVTTDEVMELVMSADNIDRLKGVNKARELDPKDCLNMLSLTSKDPDLNVRYATISQLAAAGKADPDKTLELLRELVKRETDSSVRAAVADAICALGIKEAYDDVETIFRGSSDVMVQFSILAALGELGNPKAFDLLKEVLETEDVVDLLQIAAIGALGELGDKRAIELIKPYTEAEDISVKNRAIDALSILESN